MYGETNKNGPHLLKLS